MKFRLLSLLFIGLNLSLHAAPGDSLAFIRPPSLQRGDTVAIVSPAAKMRPGSDTIRVRERLESWGLHVKFAPHYADTLQPYFAGTDPGRAADLQAMIDDPSVKAVIAYRGGYGSVRLLPALDLERLREQPKWLVGFSDITMLHLALDRLRVESIHGTMPTSFVFDQDDPSAESLRAALFGETERIELLPHPLNRPGVATGRLAGGNLTLLAAAVGTPEALCTDEPVILLIEEIGEAPYRIDRMLQQLSRSGMLGGIKALLAGHFTKIEDVDKFCTGTVYDLIDSYARPLGIPVVYGFPAGHDAPNLSVYLGREVRVTVDDQGARVEFLPEPGAEN